jgi:hypothetical protein
MKNVTDHAYCRLDCLYHRSSYDNVSKVWSQVQIITNMPMAVGMKMHFFAEKILFKVSDDVFLGSNVVKYLIII